MACRFGKSHLIWDLLGFCVVMIALAGAMCGTMLLLLLLLRIL